MSPKTPKTPEKAGRPKKTKRQGSGKRVVVGSGKDPIAITHPGADSTSTPGTPGEILYGDGPVAINAGRAVVVLKVVNTADRSIMVGSHYHFAETNSALEFDRAAAWGRRLNILAGGMTRFEPGVPEKVELVPFAGRRVMPGFRGMSKDDIDG